MSEEKKKEVLNTFLQMGFPKSYVLQALDEIDASLPTAVELCFHWMEDHPLSDFEAKKLKEQEKLEPLLQMGFSLEEANQAMVEAGQNIQLAIYGILKNQSNDLKKIIESEEKEFSKMNTMTPTGEPAKPKYDPHKETIRKLEARIGSEDEKSNEPTKVKQLEDQISELQDLVLLYQDKYLGLKRRRKKKDIFKKVLEEPEKSASEDDDNEYTVQLVQEGIKKDVGLLEISDTGVSLEEVREMIWNELDNVPDNFSFLKKGIPLGINQEKKRDLSYVLKGRTIQIQTREVRSRKSLDPISEAKEIKFDHVAAQAAAESRWAKNDPEIMNSPEITFKTVPSVKSKVFVSDEDLNERSGTDHVDDSDDETMTADQIKDELKKQLEEDEKYARELQQKFDRMAALEFSATPGNPDEPDSPPPPPPPKVNEEKKPLKRAPKMSASDYWRTKENEDDIEKVEELWKQLDEMDSISYNDIPWLKKRDLRGLKELPYEEKRVEWRKLVMLWHPDKFHQKYGAKLVDNQREDIKKQVLKIAQALARFKRKMEKRR